MRLLRWRKTKNDQDLEATRNTAINREESRSSGFSISGLIPSRAGTLLLCCIAIFHLHFNKPPQIAGNASLFNEIPNAIIHNVATNWFSTTESLTRKSVPDENNFEYVTSSTMQSKQSDLQQARPSEPATKAEATTAPSANMDQRTSPPSIQPPKPKQTKKTASAPKETKKKASAPPRQNEHKKVVTVVAQLSGELGNQMHKIANAICVQKHIERKLHLPTELKLRSQEIPRWKQTMAWMKEAFPSTRELDFTAGNLPEFAEAREIQADWIQYLVDTKQLNLKDISNPKIMNEMKSSGWQPTMEVLRLLNQTWYMDRPSAPDGNTDFSIPHVFSNTFTSRYCLEKMLPEIRDFFRLDQYKVCRQKPQPDESVFHLRNFLVEMPKHGVELGFEELSPERAAIELFKDYKPGDKVAIVSRFKNNTDKYIKALKDIRGIEARYIEGQTGNQDFCFIYKTSQEIIGQRISTFAQWAGLLGKPKKIRLYSVDSDNTRANGKHFYNAKWSHPELKHRIVYENYKA